jgi:hypothetical protein
MINLSSFIISICSSGDAKLPYNGQSHWADPTEVKIHVRLALCGRLFLITYSNI